jgi:hypothetical protein
MRFLLGKSMNLTGYSEEIFPTPHTLHPTPRLDFNLVVTPSAFAPVSNKNLAIA